MTKDCPACSTPMSAYDHEGVALDLCRECKGLWFDAGELRRVVGGPVEVVPSDAFTGPGTGSRSCPLCDVGLTENPMIGGGSLRVDACQTCCGVFLDAGELNRVHRIAARRHGMVREKDARLRNELDARHREQRRRAQSKNGSIGFEPAHASTEKFFAYLIGIPLEEDRSVERTPVVVYGLMVVLTLIWIWQLVGGFEQSVDRLGLIPDSVRAGRNLWTLVTSNFLHGGWFHLIVNLYALWVFGDNVEARLGPVRFLLLFLGWGVVGSSVSVVMATGDAATLPHIGASGAVAGAMGAYAVLFPMNRFVFPIFGVWFLGVMMKAPAWVLVVFWSLLQIVFGMMELPFVAWWDHLGGVAAGLLTGVVVRATGR